MLKPCLQYCLNQNMKCAVQENGVYISAAGSKLKGLFDKYSINDLKNC